MGGGGKLVLLANLHLQFDHCFAEERILRRKCDPPLTFLYYHKYLKRVRRKICLFTIEFGYSVRSDHIFHIVDWPFVFSLKYMVFN